MARVKSPDNTKYSVERKLQELPFIASRKANRYNHFVRQINGFFKAKHILVI
jgi:hypothetical protein